MCDAILMCVVTFLSGSAGKGRKSVCYHGPLTLGWEPSLPVPWIAYLLHTYSLLLILFASLGTWITSQANHNHLVIGN